MTFVEDKRDVVILNIRQALAEGKYDVCVEPDDPTPSSEERAAIRARFLKRFNTPKYKFNNSIVRALIRIATDNVNKDTKVVGLEKLQGMSGGAFITSNHFSPIDNTVVRLVSKELGHNHMPVVGLETNLAMTGLFGYVMNYGEIIPISKEPHYMKHDFEPILRSYMEAGEVVLIYPEEQMWFNYRKPRPGKRGAYYFAAEFGVPIISCFVEIHDLDKLIEPNYLEVSYTLHVLDPIYPDPTMNARDNSFWMCEKDYEQRVAAYEEAYGKKLDYSFTADDIAGWVPRKEQVDEINEWLASEEYQYEWGTVPSVD